MHDTNTSRESAIRSFALLLQTMRAIIHPADLPLSAWVVGLNAEYGIATPLAIGVGDRLDHLRELSALEAWEVVAAWIDAELAAVAAGETVAEERYQSIARQYIGAECVHCGHEFGPADDMVPCDYTPAGRELYSCDRFGSCRPAADEYELDELSIQRVYKQIIQRQSQQTAADDDTLVVVAEPPVAVVTPFTAALDYIVEIRKQAGELPADMPVRCVCCGRELGPDPIVVRHDAGVDLACPQGVGCNDPIVDLCTYCHRPLIGNSEVVGHDDAGHVQRCCGIGFGCGTEFIITVEGNR
ncbi:hypothetical protein [Nocardia salmonicida]|uniref:hypothetical protein n=1 Tax=Nocardia salmonicida TaxID=53431 RepID=UPI00362798C1